MLQKDKTLCTMNTETFLLVFFRNCFVSSHCYLEEKFVYIISRNYLLCVEMEKVRVEALCITTATLNVKNYF